ncbi:MAG: hypothetical protein A2879_05120 [Omnitrophica WOR_2 bacterium RIFCSPHIGHO2_01_FULL_49_10]|nr:MAG: hypothetical protein A3H12_00765 [Candidatus Uhrbacteria bacterium RIFCSPLOWO2_12_FULL_47_9]OGX29668.1 MAG: hypothetical protein A2879_05120 [Omnitrophica WOR_2 bacterium RIFCSPHIGHO2_01_FULL_49_10]OGX32662.1 MAG: hypothetical protein A3I43_03260 [Omnitrophica WOR_2 bacterium RIFCSPLOWO2_02_FULL_50_19]
MEYRIDRERLLEIIGEWDSYLRRKVRLIACGGTAMTLLGVKVSTKDIDLIVPEIAEYEYLIDNLKQLGYKPVTGNGWSRDETFIFDIFRGKKVHTTELLESPLDEGNNYLVKEFAHIYLGALNYYDLIISKLFRGDGVDFEDCLALMKVKGGEINIGHLEKRFHETASYEISEEKVNENLERFIDMLKKEG